MGYTTLHYSYIGEKNIGSRIRRIRMIEYNARLTISVKTFPVLDIISADVEYTLAEHKYIQIHPIIQYLLSVLQM